MRVFDAYASFYDLLYQDKDYAAESAFVARLLKKHSPAARSILELGCGTGGHAAWLGKAAYSLDGVDLSPAMLDHARGRLSRLSPDAASRLRFQEGDLRTLRLGKRFDAAISLSHVFSYLTADADLKAAMETLKAHLITGGVFLFDCWYGPAVLTDRPHARVKECEDDRVKLTRITEPVMRPNDNQVEVHYRLLVKDKASGRLDEHHEVHRMRYLFRPEVEALFSEVGLDELESCEWMTRRPPGIDTWSVYFLGRAREIIPRP